MFSIRKATYEDAERIANVHVNTWKNTYQELLDEKDLTNITYENRKALWETILKIQKKGHCTYVLQKDDNQEIVGFISGGPERTKRFGYDAEIYTIYILDDYQKKGFGSRLLHTFAKEMEQLGYQSILVWVLTKNPSSRFYERYEAEPVGIENTTIGQGTYQETAYGWKNLQELISITEYVSK